MPSKRAHFITSCQQLLALGAVLAVLTPASAVITLDVVREAPTGPRIAGNGHAVELTAYSREQRRTSRVPTAPVAARVREYPMTAEAGATREMSSRTAGTHSVLSRPEPVSGYGGVGVTWDRGSAADDEQLSFRVRTRTDGAWSAWTTLEYHDEHAPDPTSREGRRARPGTDLLFVGQVDDVQVRADTTGLPAPSGMTMAVVSPGRPEASGREAPAIDTGDSAVAAGSRAAAPSSGPTSVTARPTIYSRAQWGADESLRDPGSLRYFEVHAGFVHHTVNANDYTRAEVPGLLRSIYAYHTQSRGWSDVGYNFLVDRFGRVWEGRYGGIDRPVVGAHTLGYNDHAFAMSAIGNFDVAQPSSAMVEAYGAVFAWKLSLHGVDAASMKQVVGPASFPAVNGHRDAGSTACPGRFLYDRLGRIRELAGQVQQDWSGRELQSDLAATEHPDLVVRRARDGKVFVLPTGGLTGFARPVVSEGLAAGAGLVVPTPDVTGDGRADLLVRRAGDTDVLPGDGAGGFGAPVRTFATLAGRDLVTAAGDLDGDGRHDLVARDPATGALDAYLGGRAGGFSRLRAGGDWSGYDLLAAAGDLDGDGTADLLARDTSGVLWRVPGTGAGGFGPPVEVSAGWGRWATVSGGGDLTRDGRPDLVVRAGADRPAWVLPSRRNGSFGEPLGPISRFTRSGAVTGAAQYAGNAMPDVVTRRDGDVRTYPNLGTTELLAPVPTGLTLESATALLNAGDWNRDGHGDLVHRTGKGVLVLRLGDGTGRFPERLRLGSGFGDVGLLAAVGDMTGDGYPDLMGQPAGSSLRIYPGNGRQGLRESYPAHSAVTAGRQVPVGRWDADGAPDTLFRSGSALTLYPGNGPGGLTGATRLGLDVTPYDWVVGVSDLRVTGHSDVLVRERATGRLYAVMATAKGFSTRRTLGEGMGIYDLAG